MHILLLSSVYKVEKAKWTYKLAPQLAFAAMEQTKAGNYEVKAVILIRYDINDETYCQRFQAAAKKDGESHRVLAIHFQDASGQ